MKIGGFFIPLFSILIDLVPIFNTKRFEAATLLKLSKLLNYYPFILNKPSY